MSGVSILHVIEVGLHYYVDKGMYLALGGNVEMIDVAKAVQKCCEVDSYSSEDFVLYENTGVIMSIDGKYRIEVTYHDEDGPI